MGKFRIAGGDPKAADPDLDRRRRQTLQGPPLTPWGWIVSTSQAGLLVRERHGCSRDIWGNKRSLIPCGLASREVTPSQQQSSPQEPEGFPGRRDAGPAPVVQLRSPCFLSMNDVKCCVSWECIPSPLCPTPRSSLHSG